LAALGAVVRQSTLNFRVSTQLPITTGWENQGDEMRFLALLTFTFSVMLGHGAGTAGRVGAAASDDSTVPLLVRVRSHSPEVAALIGRASESSATFRRLMTSIDGTDGLIYVDYGTCGHGVRACFLLAVQVAGPFRVLHIKIDVRRTDCRLMADIGHELQHAIEVLSDPHITDGVSAYSFYERIAPGLTSDRLRFETEAAQQTGAEVRHEACKESQKSKAGRLTFDF